MSRTALIIGAGPAGVSAASELASRSDIRPIVVDKDTWIGGISRTTLRNGYRIDIGPHRFFTKSERVNALWREVLPLQGKPAWDDLQLNRSLPLADQSEAPDPEKEDKVLLYKSRLTRILFLRRFFNYPITLSLATLSNLGPVRVARIGFSYIKIRLFPIKNEKTLEDFFTNRFGNELYLTFFKDYTEKVWGVPCSQIPSDWGAQRVKGVSITEVLKHAIGSLFKGKSKETSMTEFFYYPKLGAGQMYEAIADKAKAHGAEFRLGQRVTSLEIRDQRIVAVTLRDQQTGAEETVCPDFVFSSMPIDELFSSFSGEPVPTSAMETARGLTFRDYILVKVLARSMSMPNQTQVKALPGLIPDNWIYVQERDVSMGRLDIFNNFSMYMLPEKDKAWLGCEYFSDKGDSLWSKSDAEIAAFAVSELDKLGLVRSTDILDTEVVRQEKAYPAYFGTYGEFHRIREYTDTIQNLYLMGRNGMHRYNNMDHSVLAGLVAADLAMEGSRDMSRLWDVNTEKEYHEQKS